MIRAAICARISCDCDGTELGVRRQIVDCEKLAGGGRFLKDQLAGQPVSHWTKLLMALQSIVSIVVVRSVTVRAAGVPS